MKKIQIVRRMGWVVMLGAGLGWLTGCGGSDDSAPPPASAATNAAPTEAAASMTGVWHGSFSSGQTFSLSLTQSDNVLNGTYSRDDGTGSGSASGQLNGDTLDLTTVREPGHVVAQWHGGVNADRTGASGTWTNITENSSGTFSMSK